MMSGTKRLAQQMRGTGRTAAKYHGPGGSTLGHVRSVTPEITIQPLSGGLAIPDEALGWTLTAAAARDSLVVDDVVLLTMVNGQYYVIDKVESE